MTAAFEVNFDGLVGPTHNYAGLSYGNLASTKNRLSVSNPREAALQGLAKMKFMADLGLKQAILPPQERPNVWALRRLGFGGSDADVLRKAQQADPTLLAACCSASSMWAANAATVSPSTDTGDGRVHLTPANLITQFHRAIETPETSAALRAIFPDESAFAHHAPLRAATLFGDEGAANHTRLCRDYDAPGIEVFVYGRAILKGTTAAPANFPARQTREASAAIARLHQLDPASTVFVRQNPAAIDAGAFHNDVVAVGNQNVFLYHASAWADAPSAVEQIGKTFETRCGGELVILEAKESEVPLNEAVASYLFNSQLVTLPDGQMSLIAPVECREHERVQAFIDRVIESDNPINSVHYLDVRQSMRNGGGPACLRLRVVLSEPELARVHPGVFFTDALYHALIGWVSRHYRDRLVAEDLPDPKLLEESRAALDELTRMLGLGTLYRFQGAKLD